MSRSTVVDGSAVGIQGIRLFALGEAGAARAGDLATWPLLAELARTGDKLWFYGGKEQMELLELVLAELPELTVVLNHLGFWPSAIEVDEHGRPRFEATYTAGGARDRARTGPLPARLHPAQRPLRVLRTAAALRRPAVRHRRDPRRVRPAAAPARNRLPLDPVRTGYAETIAAHDAHLVGLDEADRARVRGENAMELFF